MGDFDYFYLAYFKKDWEISLFEHNRIPQRFQSWWVIIWNCPGWLFELINVTPRNESRPSLPYIIITLQITYLLSMFVMSLCFHKSAHIGLKNKTAKYLPGFLIHTNCINKIISLVILLRFPFSNYCLYTGCQLEKDWKVQQKNKFDKNETSQNSTFKVWITLAEAGPSILGQLTERSELLASIILMAGVTHASWGQMNRGLTDIYGVSWNEIFQYTYTIFI